MHNRPRLIGLFAPLTLLEILILQHVPHTLVAMLYILDLFLEIFEFDMQRLDEFGPADVSRLSHGLRDCGVD